MPPIPSEDPRKKKEKEKKEKKELELQKKKEKEELKRKKDEEIRREKEKKIRERDDKILRKKHKVNVWFKKNQQQQHHCCTYMCNVLINVQPLKSFLSHQKQNKGVFKTQNGETAKQRHFAISCFKHARNTTFTEQKPLLCH